MELSSGATGKGAECEARRMAEFSAVSGTTPTRLTATAAGTWLVGIGLLVVLLEYAPKLGAALHFAIVLYLAVQLPKKGVA